MSINSISNLAQIEPPSDSHQRKHVRHAVRK